MHNQVPAKSKTNRLDLTNHLVGCPVNSPFFLQVCPRAGPGHDSAWQWHTQGCASLQLVIVTTLFSKTQGVFEVQEESLDTPSATQPGMQAADLVALGWAAPSQALDAAFESALPLLPLKLPTSAQARPPGTTSEPRHQQEQQQARPQQTQSLDAQSSRQAAAPAGIMSAGQLPRETQRLDQFLRPAVLAGPTPTVPPAGAIHVARQTMHAWQQQQQQQQPSHQGAGVPSQGLSLIHISEPTRPY